MVKDSPRITAGELQLLVESWGQKANKKTAPTSQRVIWEGFKKKYSGSSKNKVQHIRFCQTRLERQIALAYMVT